MCMILMMIAAFNIGSPFCEHPGASLVFVSEAPLAVRFRELTSEGAFADAESLLRSAEDGQDPETRQLVREGLDLLRRMRRDYRLEDDELLERLGRSIPDVSAENLDRWRAAGEIQWRLIDGKVAYFNREPSNLFRFCPEAKERRDRHREASGEQQPSGESPQQILNRHLAEVAEAAAKEERELVEPIRHKITYTITVHPDQVGGRRGSVIRAWLPFAQEHRLQQDVRLLRTSPEEHVIAPVAKDPYDGSVTPHRTIFFEQVVEDPSEPVAFEIAFAYVACAYYPDLDDVRARPLPEGKLKHYLCERLPHIRFTPELRQRVRQVVGDETNPLIKARLIFDDVARNIRYCAEEEYSTISGFTEKALRTGRGDCGVQSMLFITMCRAAGIPARWQSGFETQPQNWNLHDWAEFYVEPWGWLPADVSYGYRKSEDFRVRDFYFGHQDAYRLIVNMDYGFPLHPAKQSLRSEPADFQRGEVELDGRNLYFDEWDWNLELDTQPLRP